MKSYDDLVFDRQALLDAFPLPVFLSDEDQLFHGGNKAFHDFVKRTTFPEGFKVTQLIDTPLPRKEIQKLDQEVLNTGTSKSLELTINDLAGAEYQVIIQKTRLIDPARIEPPRILNTLQDVTRQHRAQSALHDAIGSIAEAFVMYDKDGKLEICNQNFRDMYHYTDEQAKPGVHFKELGEVDIVNGNVAIGDEKGEDYLERKAAYRRELKGSFTVNLKDGRWIRTTDRAVPGRGFVSVQSDITAVKKSQTALTVAKETAELASRAKSEFLANMSHELRTPLNSIIGFSQILMGEMFGEHSNIKYQEYSEAINRSSNHLLELISEILDQSKIELGTVSLEEETTKVPTMLDECVGLVKERSLQAGIEISVHCPPTLPNFFLDRLKVKQTILNLLTNALKFTDAGGCVIIDAGLNKNQGLEIHVRDNGIGIPESDLKRVLEPFAQVAESKTRNHDGTGLGLSIAKSFIELHGGVLKIESDLGQGTTVRLSFPPERIR